jgi:hypothetical protein
MRQSSAILIACCAFASVAFAQQGFKFSNPSPDEQAQAAEQVRRQQATDFLLSTPCGQRLKNRKIVVLVGEETNGRITAPQGQWGRHVDAINTRLRGLGLRTFSPEEIRKQIAQEEVDAIFKNDPDRAISASKRMGAQYVLKGVIATQAFRSAAPGLNQVNVSMEFSLADSSGRPVSNTRASNSSYAGTDVSGMALKLIEERADEAVAQLYSDYCKTAR